MDDAGRRVAVEVTELVSADAIRAYKSGRVYDFAFWDRDLFLSSLTEAISRKDANFGRLRDPPYDGGYELIVFTDEPMVSRSSVEKWLTKEVFRVEHLSRAVLLLGYDPGLSRCPFYELPLGA